ncbi:MAG: hypothetical protein HY369_02885 [Candidatus Aenigmarchaeota archaeon]|nr:hypothetical protein [Candidatus Aenigmarchaeota archaeon]
MKKRANQSKETAGQVPAGRPSDGGERNPPMRHIHFLATPEVAEAIEEMKEAIEENGAQSIVLRRAVLNEHARWRAERRAK